LLRIIAALSLVVAVSACSSSSGSNTASPPPPPPPPASDWQPGVFGPWDGFIARCENPRAGTDPLTNAPYFDVQGTLLDENNFLRSYSNDTYLWYDEIVDQDPGLFNDPTVYFQQLKTFEELVPGVPKDPPGFHFSLTDEEYINQFQTGVTFGYGAQFVILSNDLPRDITISFTEPNSSATDQGLARGTRILAVDGVSVDTNDAQGINTLNAGLFPTMNGEQHEFTVLDLGAQASRTVMLTAGEVTRAFVQNAKVIDTGTARVGYLTFFAHRPTAEKGLVDAVNLFNEGDGIDDLVLDLRYNGGGLLDLAAQVGYMIAGPAATTNETFELQLYNDKYPVVDPIFGETIEPVPFVDETLGWDPALLPAGDPLPTLNLSRVFVITTASTCSASEAVINALRGVDIEVIQIGSTTCGKPYGFFPTPNCGNVYFTIQFKGVNAKGFGDYALGFVPSPVDDGLASIRGCPVDDDFSALLGDTDEDMLEVALAYRDGFGCIAPSAGAPGLFSKPGTPADVASPSIHTSPLDTARILTRPWHER
jgi:C-terminal processing protease CtpA/Prc